MKKKKKRNACHCFTMLLCLGGFISFNFKCSNFRSDRILLLGNGSPVHMSNLCGLDVIITFLNNDLKNFIVMPKTHCNNPTSVGHVGRVIVSIMRY